MLFCCLCFVEVLRIVFYLYHDLGLKILRLSGLAISNSDSFLIFKSRFENWRFGALLILVELVILVDLVQQNTFLVQQNCLFGSAKQLFGSAKQPFGSAKQLFGSAKQPSGSAKHPSGSAKQPSGCGRGTTTITITTTTQGSFHRTPLGGHFLPVTLCVRGAAS